MIGKYQSWTLFHSDGKKSIVQSIVIDFSDYRLLISDFCSVNLPSLVAIWNILKAIVEPIFINLFPSDYRL